VLPCRFLPLVASCTGRDIRGMPRVLSQPIRLHIPASRRGIRCDLGVTLAAASLLSRYLEGSLWGGVPFASIDTVLRRGYIGNWLKRDAPFVFRPAWDGISKGGIALWTFHICSHGRIIHLAAISEAPALSDLSSTSTESIAISSFLLAPIRCSLIRARDRESRQWVSLASTLVAGSDGIDFEGGIIAIPIRACTLRAFLFAHSPRDKCGIVHRASGHGSPCSSLSLLHLGNMFQDKCSYRCVGASRLPARLARFRLNFSVTACDLRERRGGMNMASRERRNQHGRCTRFS